MRRLTDLFFRTLSACLLALPPLTTSYSAVEPVYAAPAIANLSAGSIAATSAVITWTTDVAASSQVQFGPTSAYGATTTADPTPVTTHSVSLAALTGNTTYHYQVISKDGLGNTSVSADASFTTGAPNPASATVGEWSPVLTWPLVAVHSSLLYTGEVITWDAWETNGTVSARIWNPFTQTFAGVPLNSLIFCAGQVELADGRLLVAGGHGLTTTIGTAETNIFDPATRTWTAGPRMHSSRWYPAVTTMGDGRVVSLSGQITETTWADTPEIYNPTTTTWSTLPVSTSNVHDDEYPFDFLLPSGKLFNLTPSVGGTSLLDVNAGTWLTAGLGSAAAFNGSAAMYRPGKILYTGGGPLGGAAVTTASVVDMTQPTPAWQQVAPMAFPRYEHNLTAMPDGQVLALGGVQTVDQTVQDGSLSPEMFDPDSGTWSTMAAQHDVRQYHSTAMLLPDGRVLSAGGGRWSTATDYLTAEIYSPPYLFKGPRPSVTAAPTSTTYGGSMQVDTPDGPTIARVSLTGLAADTHTSDMDQHYVELPFTVNSTGLTVQSPTSSNVVPAGYYMLWLINNQGVPSFARIVQVAGTAQNDTQAPAVRVTAPADGANVSGTVTLSANATDNVGVAGVQFTLDGNPVGGSLSSPPYSETWNTTTTPNGTHTLSARATDLAGNVGTAATVSITVNNASVVPPAISSVFAKNVSATAATITWSTDKPSDSQIQYGTTTAYGSATTVDTSAVTSHSVSLTGLTSGTTYHYQVDSRDTGGNLGTSSDGVFTTTATTPLNLVGDQVVEASADSNPAGSAEAFQYTAGSTGTANEIAVYVDTGNTGNPIILGMYSNNAANAPGALLAQGTIVNPTSSTWNNVAIPPTQVTAGTKYWVAAVAPAGTIQIRDRAAGGGSQSSSQSNLTSLPATWTSGTAWSSSSMSAYLTGTTSADTQPPTVSVSAPTTGATVSGSTSLTATASDNVGVSSVQFTLDGVNLGSALTTTPYSMSWDTTTVTNGAHTIGARATDAAGNIGTATAVSVSVSNVDTTPPVISGTAASGLLPTGVTIAWTTNEPADSQVQYGVSTSYGSSTAHDPALVTSHSQGVSGLTPATTYFCQILTRDASGNLATATLSFATPALTATAVASKNLTSSAATVTWTTNEATTSQVEYGTTSAYGSSTTLDTALLTSHSVGLTGLSASTTYHYRVKGADSAGYQVVSADNTFTTAAAAPTVLVGDSRIEGSVDFNGAGSAEAFQYTAGSTGTVNTLSIYVEATSTATKLVLGVYTNNASNNPATLLGQATIASPAAGAWNSTTLPTPVSVTAGTKYWLTVLAPTGSGTIKFRDVASGGKSQNSSQTNLAALPATWSSGGTWANSPMSAYAGP